MTKYVLLASVAGLVALTGCSKTEEPVVNNEMAAAVPADEMTSAAPTPGTYDVTDADGKVTQTTINADGSFETKDGDTVLYSGMINNVDGKNCFDPEGEGATVCYTDSAPDADGMFTATPDNGEPAVTVRPAG